MTPLQIQNSPVAGYRLVVPDGWFAVDLDPARCERAVAALTARQFSGFDNAPHLKAQARRELLARAETAYTAGGLEMFLSLEQIAGIPLAASLVIFLVAPPGDGCTASPGALAQSLEGDGRQASLVDLPTGTAVRLLKDAGGAGQDQQASSTLEMFVPVPGHGGWLLLSFSTPLGPLAAAMTKLFDAICTTPKVGHVTELQWKPVIYLPATLTVEFGADVLKADDPAAWCQRRAAELLGPNGRPQQVRGLTRCLEEYAAYFRSKDLQAHAALFFYPDFTCIPPRAEAQVFLVGEDPLAGPMTLARAREICGPDERSFGQTDMTETEVSAGPALRVHRYRKLEPAKRRTRIVEELDWVICPPGSTQAVMILTTWDESMFSKAAISIADDMARNFRIEPAA